MNKSTETVPVNSSEKKVPKSFIVRTGPLKSAALQDLVLNMRKMMEPNTALKLKVALFYLWLSAILIFSFYLGT